MSKALADKFREYAKDRVVFSGKSGKSNSELRGFNKAVYLLEQMPDDEAEGHWIEQVNEYEIPFDYIYICSLCDGAVHLPAGQSHFNFGYCPYCGKRLKGMLPYDHR